MLKNLDRDSVLHKWLLYWDNLLSSLDGFEVDFEKLDAYTHNRELFRKDYYIKTGPSVIPGRDRKLKAMIKRFGGWRAIVLREPDECLYKELEILGFSREDFDLTRRYLANPSAYRRSALQKKC